MSVADKVKEIIVEQLGVDADEVTTEASFTDDLGVLGNDRTQLFDLSQHLRASISGAENDRSQFGR